MILSKFKTIQLLFVFSFFPVWIVRSDLVLQEIALSLLLFLLIPLLSFYFFLKKFDQPYNSFLLFIISLIFIYGLDNHLGLRTGMLGLISTITGQDEWLAATFGIYKYLVSLLFLLSLSLIIFFITKKTDKKFIKILLITIISLAVFNVFDHAKKHTEIVYFEKSSNINKLKKTTLVMIFDETSGIDSYESSGPKGKNFIKFSEYFFKKYKFNVYRKAETLSSSTVTSIVNLTNYRNDIIFQGKYYEDSLNRSGYIEPANTYYQAWSQTKNKFFNGFSQISVHQGMTTNYCKLKNVYKCETFNPFKQRDFMDGFKNTPLTRIVSINQMNGSIIGRLIWRILRQFRFIDSIAMPEGEKPALIYTLKEIEKDIYSEKYDLIFFHPLVPHTPYGYDSSCKYNGGISFNTSFMNLEKKVEIHNNERTCILKFLDIFLSNIKSNNRLDDLNIVILSDHGARIKQDEHSSVFSTMLAYRDVDSEYINYDFKITIQDFFKNKLKKK